MSKKNSKLGSGFGTGGLNALTAFDSKPIVSRFVELADDGQLAKIHLLLCARPCCRRKPATAREVGIGVVVNHTLWTWFNAYEVWAPALASAAVIDTAQYYKLTTVRDLVEFGEQ